MSTLVEIAFLIALLVGLWLLAKLFGMGRPPAEKGRSAGPALQLPGDGDFETEVVGESYYQDALTKIAGPKTPAGVDLNVRASLVPEPDNPHDSNAVAIYIQGLKVGHLPRDMAAEWVATLRRRGDARAVVEVAANITGGWRRERRDGQVSEGSFGVSLDIFDELDD